MKRPIAKYEQQILERALRVDLTPSVEPYLRQIPKLNVTANCKCGCATIWFGPEGDAVNGTKLAEVVATAAGQQVTVLIWSSNQSIVGLEFVGHGAVPLPEVESVRSWRDA